MCGAYGFSVKDAQEVYNRFDIENTLEDFRPRFNVRPGQMNPVVTSIPAEKFVYTAGGCTNEHPGVAQCRARWGSDHFAQEPL
jgi:putative SOS response-associated peptidase YedK